MDRDCHKQAMSLIEVIVAITVATVGLIANLKIADVIKQLGRSSELRPDLQQVVSTIRSTLSCQQTRSRFGTSRPITCQAPVTL